METETANGDVHWIEVIDAQGILHLKMLGPYATAMLANRACRGILRLLNARRCTATVVSQRDIDGRGDGAGPLRS